MGGCFSYSATLGPRGRDYTIKLSPRGSSTALLIEEMKGADASCFSSGRPPGAHAVPLGKRTQFGYRTGFKSTYKVERQLGHGTFGRTFVATHLTTGTQVAVKVIPKSKMLIPTSVADVKREVKIMQALSGHENVVEFHEAFEDKDFVYIVMELCRGGELLPRIVSKKGTQYTERDAARLVRKMLKMVANCHLCGIVHRDLKPENFLFKTDDDDSELKTIDFGLSDYIKPGSVFKDVVGSPCYLAPEVLRQRSGAGSDVWSVGIIMYILLCGRRPFWARTENDLFQKILEEDPDFCKKPWPSVSSSAKDLVKKLLVKNPHTRFTAAQALSHPWLREVEAHDIPLDISVLSNIREFVRCGRLRKIALRAVTSILSADKITNLEDQFNAMDTDKDGTLSRSEIHEALAEDKTWHLQETMVLEILSAMDTNEDGRVDFNEFAAAAVRVHQLEGLDPATWHKQCVAAFEKLDVDKNGYLTPDELKLFSNMSSSFGSLIDEADFDKDGRLNLREFQQLLQ